ncbi:hypothetical protein N7G274_002711 [Stereocaulon virgatum]|uniref:LAGLIDADG homing endonuclease n=1 Tax=Stereocaulon virgatum TaxID=373712 RepID=A0ABR4AHD8_9LECA
MYEICHESGAKSINYEYATIVRNLFLSQLRNKGFAHAEGNDQQAKRLDTQARPRDLLSHFKRWLVETYIYSGSLEKTHIDLAMSHDNNQVTSTSKKSKHNLHLLGLGQSDYVQKLDGILATD